MDAKQKIGMRIKQLRHERGLSQESFALLCDLDRTYVASVEAGKRNISIMNIDKVAKAFDISLTQLFSSEIFE